MAKGIPRVFGTLTAGPPARRAFDIPTGMADCHGVGGEDETVVLDRNAADFPEDFLAMFE